MLSILDPINFIQGHINENTTQPLHVIQQVALRAYLCPECDKLKKCTHCGCATPAMFYAPLKEDSNQRWSTFLSKNQWEALVNNIEDYYKFIKSLKNENTNTVAADVQPEA